MTDTSQTTSHGREQNIQTASCKDMGSAQISTTRINSLVMEQLSDKDFPKEKLR